MVIQNKPNYGGGFFTTAAGRKIVFYAAGATAVGLFVGNFVPHTFGLSYYKQFMQSYENGIERPIPDKVQKRVDYAMDKLEVAPFERKIIKPFTVFGFDLFQAGSTNHRFGCALGIPMNYAYDDAKDINKSEIRLGAEPINWNSDSGKLLEESIVLTEAEQIFGLCKSIMLMRTYQVVLNSVFPSLSFFMVYTIGHYLNHRLNLLNRHASVRFVMYSILGLFGMGSWSFLKDYSQVSYDAEIDKTLSSMGPEFVAAGVSYYDKTLKKNIALRALVGDDTYTAKGNINYFVRQKSLPLTIRKSFFEEKWNELKKSTDTSPEINQ